MTPKHIEERDHIGGIITRHSLSVHIESNGRAKHEVDFEPLVHDLESFLLTKVAEGEQRGREEGIENVIGALIAHSEGITRNFDGSVAYADRVYINTLRKDLSAKSPKI